MLPAGKTPKVVQETLMGSLVPKADRVKLLRRYSGGIHGRFDGEVRKPRVVFYAAQALLGDGKE
jgi:hypothetical protein